MRLIGILFFISIGISAQQPQFEPLGKSDGLSNSSVLTILKDSKGFMWFGTFDGLNKYDGTNITEYKHNPSIKGSISNNKVQTLFEDSRQNLWVGTTNGLNRYDPKKDEFTAYLHSDSVPSSISHQNIKAIHEDENGYIWVGTIGGGLNRYDPSTDTFKRYQFKKGDASSIDQEYMLAINQSKKGFLWIGLAGRGVDLLDIENEKFYHLKYLQQDQDQNFRNNVIRDIYPTNDNKLLISTYGGFNILNLDYVNVKKADTLTNNINVSFQHFEHSLGSQEPQLSNSSVHSAVVDSKGNYWIATYGGGLNWYNPKTNDFRSYTTYLHKGTTMSLSSIFDLYYDEEQQLLWVATGGNGVVKVNLDPKPFESWDTDNNTVTALAENKKYYWAGTYDQGILRKLKGTDEIKWFKSDVNNSQSLSSNYINDIEMDSTGNLWIATEHQGVTLLLKEDFEKPRFKHFKYDENDTTSLKNNAVQDLELVSDSTLLAISAYGVSFINTVNHKVTRWNKSMSDTHEIDRLLLDKALHLSNGELLIGGGEGLYSLKRKQEFPRKYDVESFGYLLSDSTSLNDNKVHDMIEDEQGRVWIGTNRGLNQYLAKNGTFIRYPKIWDGRVMGLVSDKNGILWISTESGIICFNPNTNTCNLFEVQIDGEIKEFYESSKQGFRDGRLGFGMASGFISFDPNTIQIDTASPTIRFTDLKIFGKDYSIRNDSNKVEVGGIYLENHINYTEQLRLNYEDKLFTIQFAALDYRNPGKIQYQYRLLGWDDQWVSSGNVGEAQFTNLDPGNYTLQVLSTNTDGVWSESPKVMIITIVPPWWMTWWFKLVLVVCSLLLLSIPFYLRIQKLKKSQLAQQRIIEVIANTQEEERQRISRDLHDSVGGQLVGVKQQLSNLSREVPEITNTISVLDETYDEVRRIAHNITPGTLMKFGLVAGIESIASRAQSNDTQVNTYFHEVDGQFDKDFETNVFRMVQELLQNAVKHAHPSHINISLTRRNGELSIMVEDDGKGFDVDHVAQNGGNGLKNVQYRVEKAKGKVVIDSSTNNGTQVNIELPIT